MALLGPSDNAYLHGYMVVLKPMFHIGARVSTPYGCRDDDAVLSDLSSSDEDAPQIKAGHRPLRLRPSLPGAALQRRGASRGAAEQGVEGPVDPGAGGPWVVQWLW